jgi:large subunit ribosomal protein L14
MIGLLSKVKIIDNSGGILGTCLKVLRKAKPQIYAKIGDVIVISVNKITSGSKIQKGDVIKAVVVRTKYQKWSRWSDNAVILIAKGEITPLGTRIKGPISKIIKNPKIISLAKNNY